MIAVSFREILSELINDHWAKLLAGLLIFFVGRWWGWWRARRSWEKKEFLSHLTVSLNTIYERDGAPTLGIRTVLEKSLEEIFLNRVAVERFLRYAEKTTEARSLVPMPEEDRWHLLNSVLNEIAEKFSTGTIDRDLGLPVRVERYLVFLTREVDGDVRTHKPRAMLVRKDQLLDGAFEPEEPLGLESPHHQKRVKTLAEAATAYRSDPSGFLELEIVRPAPAQT